MKQQLDRLMRDNPFLPLSDAIYQCLFYHIIHLTLPPGSKLNESRIAEELGVSRTPVKGALNRLTDERLAQKRDGKLLIVSPMTKGESRLLYEARIAVEGYAAYLAALRISSQELDALEKLVEEYREIGRSLNPATYADCDHRFHATIIQASGNSYLREMYRHIEPRLLHYRHCLLYEIGDSHLQPILADAARHHVSVFRALQLGFADTARSEIERDIGGMNDVFSAWQ